MPKKIEELTEDEVLDYYVCEICKQLCLLSETATCDFKTLCKCKNCMALERDKIIKKEEDNLKKLKKDRLDEIKKYLS